MFLKSIVSILIVTSSFILAFGQTPEAKKDTEKSPTAFAWTFQGDGSYLGVETQEVSKENFAKFGLRDVRGVAVAKVIDNSPAAAAGLQTGDVIVRFNGEEITGSRKLTRLIGEIDPDHQAKITVVRNGSEQEIMATMAKRTMPKFNNGNFEFRTPMPMGKLEMPDLKSLPQLKDLPAFKEFPKGDMPQVFMSPNGEGQSFMWRSGEGRQIGIGVTSLTKQLGEHFGVDGGVMISEVRENSPASRAGLRAGDIIVQIDGKAVKGDFDLIRIINGKKDGDVTLTIVRDRNRQTITVTPEASKDNGFFFRTGDENGLATPATPGQMPLTRPIMPASPMIAPVPMTMVRPGRIM